MRRRGGRFGRRKVNVPNLSGLSRSQAKSLLESVGLNWSENSTSVQNINLDQSIIDQETPHNSVVRIGETVSFNYYTYVAPPPPPAPPVTPYPNIGTVIAYGAGAGQAWTQNQAVITWGGSGWGSYTVVASNGSSNNEPTSSSANFPVLLSGFSAGTTYSVTVTLYANANYSGSSASSSTSFTTAAAATPPSGPPTPPSGPPPSPPAGCQEYGVVPGSAGPCNYNPVFGGGSRAIRRYNVDCTTYEDYEFCSDYTPPTGPPADPPIYAPPSGPPIDLPPLGPPIGKSVSVTTLIRTPSGLVSAESLNIGDILLSANLEGFPYNPGEGIVEEAFSWTSDNPNLNIVNTTIVGITRRISEKAVIVNGDIFSDWHWILVKRDGITKFVRSEDIIEGTDYIFDVDSNSWEIVDLFEVIQVGHETVSIDCEPYDMFFTEKMLTHDSFSI